MNEGYPALYSDLNGAEETILRNDGKTLRLSLRGVEFSGSMFDDFTPEAGTQSSALLAFHINQFNELCDCQIEWEMPLPVVINGEEKRAALHGHIVFGVPDQRGRLDKLELRLTLRVEGREYSGAGRGGYFEYALLEIQNALPENMDIKSCITCAFSDYLPVGSGMFGCMACFRDKKAAYLQVKDKYDLLDLWQTPADVTEQVQETYLCPEFQKREPGAGYRG